MNLWQRNRMVGLIVGCSLSLAGSASAGPYVNLMQPCDCPPNHYSAFEVLTPSLYRWAAWCQGPCRYTFARVLHPDIAPTYYVKKYHCPSVNPLQFALENYPGLSGTPPASTYQSPPELTQQKRQIPPESFQQVLPPQLRSLPTEKLPPPKEEKK